MCLSNEEGAHGKLATYGHIGRMDFSLPWELTDRVELLLETKQCVRQATQ